jgi:lactoylglutathione lyase
MASIVHLAVKVTDVERAATFYETVFGFRRSETTRKRGHVSCHMTDGRFDLALIQYDTADTTESNWAGEGPCIHHFGIAVEDTDAVHRRLVDGGFTILSSPGVMPIKFRGPDGVVMEVGPSSIFPGVDEGAAAERKATLEHAEKA